MKNTIFTADNYIIKTVSVADYCASNINFPPLQLVRGSVWKEDTARTLVEDIKAGRYVPPIVVAGDDDLELSISDGQQRTLAIQHAYTNGDLTGDETILIAIDAGRSFQDSFNRLNVGVPVGAGLVMASSYDTDTSANVVSLASHKLFTSYKWTSTQVQRAAKADFSSAALAICAGWSNPESSNKAVGKFLESHPCTEEDKVKAEDFLDSLSDALRPYFADEKLKGDAGKIARKVLAQLRKKSLFMTACGLWLQGGNLETYCRLVISDKLLGEIVTYTATINGKARKMRARWTVGGGSSGSASEYKERLIFADIQCRKLQEMADGAVDMAEDQAAKLADASNPVYQAAENAGI